MTDHLTDIIRDAIEPIGTATLDDYAAAAAKAMREAVPALVWKDDNDTHRVRAYANCSFGRYYIGQRFFPESHFMVKTPTGLVFHVEGLKDAKAAAETDHRARIAKEAGWEG